MKIARAQEQDFSSIIGLWNECGLTRPWNDPEKDLRFALKGSTSTVLLGTIETELVASVMVGHDGHRGVFYYLAVSPHHQSKGYGRAIHDGAVAWLKAQGVWKINLLVRAENEKVLGFYQRLGYADNKTRSLGKPI